MANNDVSPDTKEIESQLNADSLAATDKHYLETVSDLGDTEDISASQDIYSGNGVLLVKKGNPINGKTYNSLAKHQLRESVDHSLTIGNSLTNAELYKDLNKELQSYPPLIQMSKAITNPISLQQCLQHVFVNDLLRNKITVAKKTRPELYTHSLRVSISSAMLGFYLGMSRDDCDCLATAGLIHDLGDLHIDTTIFSSNQLLLPEEKQVIYAHPVIMYKLLRNSSAYHPKVTMPVLEHHERTWGTGYPRGIEIYHSKLSAVLAMTEVLISLSERDNFVRVLSALKSHDNTFDKELIAAITKAFKTMDFAGSEAAIKPVHSREYLELICGVQAAWESCSTAIKESTTADSLFDKLSNWMYGIQKAIDCSGINLADDDPLALFNDDASLMQEAHYHLDEVLYTLCEILDALERDRLKNKRSIFNSSEALLSWMDKLRETVTAYKGLNGP